MIITDRVKQRLVLSGVQTAALLAIEDLMQKSGLVVLCPRCAAEGHLTLQTNNAPDMVEWKMDCLCRERRMYPSEAAHVMDADGDLMSEIDAILAPVSLAVRCPYPRCVQRPLEVERSEKETILRCRCAQTTIPTNHRPTVH